MPKWLSLHVIAKTCWGGSYKIRRPVNLNIHVEIHEENQDIWSTHGGCSICSNSGEQAIQAIQTIQYGRFIQWITTDGLSSKSHLGILNWLVVDLPLWKMMEWKSVGMMTFSIRWEKWKSSKPPTSICCCYIYITQVMRLSETSPRSESETSSCSHCPVLV